MPGGDGRERASLGQIRPLFSGRIPGGDGRERGVHGGPGVALTARVAAWAARVVPGAATRPEATLRRRGVA